MYLELVYLDYFFDMIMVFFFFFFNDTATTEIYTLSLHDALPISGARDDGHLAAAGVHGGLDDLAVFLAVQREVLADRKSTRLNSSHGYISYAVFCLKKKKNINVTICFIR